MSDEPASIAIARAWANVAGCEAPSSVTMALARALLAVHEAALELEADRDRLLKDADKQRDFVKNIQIQALDELTKLRAKVESLSNCFICPNCGRVAVDEDWLCTTCGRGVLVFVDGRLSGGSSAELLERDAIPPRSVHPSHLPTVMDLLETERDELRAEIQSYKRQLRDEYGKREALDEAVARLRERVVKLNGCACEYNIDCIHDDDCPRWGLKQERDRLLVLVRKIPAHTKHGPFGSGQSGTCDSDCLKCLAEAALARSVEG